jgi:hypothetical protein
MDAHASQESALWVCRGYAADNGGPRRSRVKPDPFAIAGLRATASGPALFSPAIGLWSPFEQTNQKGVIYHVQK